MCLYSGEGDLTGVFHVLEFSLSSQHHPSSLAEVKARMVDILVPDYPHYPEILAVN